MTQNWGQSDPANRQISHWGWSLCLWIVQNAGTGSPGSSGLVEFSPLWSCLCSSNRTLEDILLKFQMGLWRVTGRILAWNHSWGDDFEEQGRDSRKLCTFFTLSDWMNQHLYSTWELIPCDPYSSSRMWAEQQIPSHCTVKVDTKKQEGWAICPELHS